MSSYIDAFEKATGQPAPPEAGKLDQLFNQIRQGKTLPPRGQQAVAMGLTAHTLNDAREDPALFAYYRWVMTHCFKSGQVNELTARLIGMA
ncbi:MAG: hypothetical protein L0K99_10245, partial [Lacticaseibacillus paracasei]|nr:hypothetical protein [Lacticaseibacillus paracasei]MDN6767730.1 hypothetical protein [Lacticaseibacillus paracasei]